MLLKKKTQKEMDYREALRPFGIDFDMSVERERTGHRTPTLGTRTCTVSPV